MATGMWGRKIGMTQLFTEDSVIPVSAIDVGRWVVTGLKNEERDGYVAAQIGCIKKRYKGQQFNTNWLKNIKKYFSFVREIPLAEGAELSIGQNVDFNAFFETGQKVHISGKTIGRGFAGVVRRHNFAGPPASHGSTMGKKPGSIGFRTACGFVRKGKKLPGHMGNVQRTMQNLEIIKFDESEHVVFVKGSIPGKKGSLVFVRKA